MLGKVLRWLPLSQPWCTHPRAFSVCVPPRRSSTVTTGWGVDSPCHPAAVADQSCVTKGGTLDTWPWQALFLVVDECPPSVVVLCTARFVAQTTKVWGTRPSGGEYCLAAVSFLSPWVAKSAGGDEAPGSRPVHGFSDRTGTDKGWYSKA